MKSNNEQSWDEYWSSSEEKSALSRLYDVIASIYRNKLIGPRLDFELSKAFPNGAQLIHAGSGAGEVDSCVSSKFKITAVDISGNAVTKYSQLHPEHKAVQLDIFKLHGLDEKFDGLYNLGVMEHFSSEECTKILISAHSVLKPGGKVILFWPPHFGLSVLFLHFVHGVLRLIQGKNFQSLHPEEPNKASTPRVARKVLEASGFKLTRFSFSARDAFTYVVIVGERV
jgi:2-polyprenyl-3-methyl-5-hydroxy-6-metoxy-1,4-benzoquinol methylase